MCPGCRVEGEESCRVVVTRGHNWFAQTLRSVLGTLSVGCTFGRVSGRPHLGYVTSELCALWWAAPLPPSLTWVGAPASSGSSVPFFRRPVSSQTGHTEVTALLICSVYSGVTVRSGPRLTLSGRLPLRRSRLRKSPAVRTGVSDITSEISPKKHVFNVELFRLINFLPFDCCSLQPFLHLVDLESI